jgi:hypothetical protein
MFNVIIGMIGLKFIILELILSFTPHVIKLLSHFSCLFSHKFIFYLLYWLFKNLLIFG